MRPGSDKDTNAKLELPPYVSQDAPETDEGSSGRDIPRSQADDCCLTPCEDVANFEAGRIFA